MKILSIGLDKRILNKDSATFCRQKKHAQLVDELHIVVFGTRKNKIKSGNLFIYGSGGGNKIVRFLNAHKIAKKILKNKVCEKPKLAYGSLYANRHMRIRKKDWLVTTQDPFFCGFLGYLLRRKFNIKLHVQLHGDFFSSKYFGKECLYNRFQYILGKFIIKKADGFRVVSQRTKNSLVGLGISEDKITVVPIYTEMHRITTEDTKERKEKFVFLTVGRLVPVKNIGLQIKAMTEIIKDYPDAELWVVGDGPEKKGLQAISYKLQVTKNVRFWGWQDDLGKFYRQADVFLLTSNYEGWGLTVIEAANYGLPIIMTDVGCAGEVIENKKSGLVIPVGNQKKLREAMIKLIEDKELRKKLGEAPGQTILTLSDKQKTLKLYKKSWEATYE